MQGDIQSVSDFIRIWCTKYQRWLSPKFLAGESYGTTRAAGLSEQLHDRYGLDLNGIVLISTVLNFLTLEPSAGNDAPYPLFLPSYTAIAWYHKKLPQDLQGDLAKAVAEAQLWAMGEYTTALAKGSALQGEARERIVQDLSRYCGLPPEYVRRSSLRISPARFEKQLLADRQRVIGRMDGRISGHDSDPLNDTPDFDPSLTGYIGLFADTFNDYVRRELKYESDLPYEFLSPQVGPWDFSQTGGGPRGEGSGRGQGYLNVATTLRRAMVAMPALKVMVASGYYDLATPFTGADYTINQMPLGKELRDNIAQHYYEGGHMLYLNKPALEKLKSDLRDFYGRCLSK
ncbi:MAG: S10 family peptidase [Tepidisphaeraceae bacterium]